MERTAENTATSKITPSTKKVEATEKKGNLLICDIWKNGTDSVHDTHVVNTDTNSNSAKTPEKCLQEEEQAKKKNVPGGMPPATSTFLPFVTSIDGILGAEAADTPKSISICLTTKWKQPYSRT